MPWKGSSIIMRLNRFNRWISGRHRLNAWSAIGLRWSWFWASFRFYWPSFAIGLFCHPVLQQPPQWVLSIGCLSVRDCHSIPTCTRNTIKRPSLCFRPTRIAQQLWLCCRRDSNSWFDFRFSRSDDWGCIPDNSERSNGFESPSGCAGLGRKATASQSNRSPDCKKKKAEKEKTRDNPVLDDFV